MSNLYREVKIVGHRKKRIYHKKQEKNNYTNDLDFSVKHWIYKNNLRKERLSFPPFHLKYNDYNQLINMVESNTQMHQAIRKIANHKRIDWRRKSQRIEEIIKNDVYTIFLTFDTV